MKESKLLKEESKFKKFIGFFWKRKLKSIPIEEIKSRVDLSFNKEHDILLLCTDAFTMEQQDDFAEQLSALWDIRVLILPADTSVRVLKTTDHINKLLGELK